MDEFVTKVKKAFSRIGLDNESEYTGDKDRESLEEKYYEMRRLEYNDFVVLEQIIRNGDCDFDDFLTSSKFHKDEEPNDWQIEMMVKDEDYDGNYDYE